MNLLQETYKMSNVKNLRLMCVNCNLEFPDFIFSFENEKNISYSVFWYNQKIVSHSGDISEEHVILQNVLNMLNQWLDYDKNFIYLCELDKKSKKIDIMTT